MKKFFVLILSSMLAISVSAQKQIIESSCGDNWSIGAEGGVMWSGMSHWSRYHGGIAGLNITKGITPVVSIEFSGKAYIQDAGMTPLNEILLRRIDAFASTKINLMNWWGGYLGQPRRFEVQARGGIGYIHDLSCHRLDLEAVNSCAARLGLDFDFNLGKARDWSISVRPAFVLPVTTGSKCYGDDIDFQLTAGFAYRFGNSNGTHNFKYGRAYDQSEVDDLNSKINAARAEVANRDRQIEGKNKRIDELEKALKACESKPAVVVTNTVVNTETKENLECYVYFKQGKKVIDASQLPNVERIATYLKHNANSTVIVKGYASPEGSEEINIKIAQARADAVKNALIKRYKIEASRIVAEGQGVGNSFSEPDWNRVSICTIKQ